MKRLLLAVLPLVAASTVSLAQSVSQSTFVAKYTSWNNHLLNNQTNLAQQDFEDLKPMFISNFADGKTAIANAPNQATKDALLATHHTKQTIYSEIMNLAADMVNNRPAIKAKFDDFAALY
ncbi:MAG TPA: hypothetical protein VEB40_08620 [Flavipsychrobacter sp.]|nr:hypothetical protein [Flavipsychrobacter sp.]